jgi:hypothetical protein
MKRLGNFHDGCFQGLWIEGKTAYVQLADSGRQLFTAVATGLVALSAGGFRAGSIILDVTVREHEQVMFEDIQSVYDLLPSPEGNCQGARLLEKARQERLIVLEVSASYGATCLLLAQSVELFDRGEWLEKYCNIHAKRAEGSRTV